MALAVVHLTTTVRTRYQQVCSVSVRPSACAICVITGQILIKFSNGDLRCSFGKEFRYIHIGCFEGIGWDSADWIDLAQVGASGRLL
jgi:hypothetical protein